MAEGGESVLKRGIRRDQNAEGLDPADGLLVNFKASQHKLKFIFTEKTWSASESEPNKISAREFNN